MLSLLKRKREDNSDTTYQKAFQESALQFPCAGLTNATWPRPGSRFTILDCIAHSPTPFHGAYRHKIQKQLFGEIREATLTLKQHEQL